MAGRDPPRSGSSSPFAFLGLDDGATVAQIREARRRLAKSLHPDRGGDPGRMQELNEAAAVALDVASGRRQRPSPPVDPRPAQEMPTVPSSPGRVIEDLPSFVVEALPVVAFDVLERVAPRLGAILDDEPPYVLDVDLAAPLRCICRLQLFPEAGATSVGLVLVAVDRQSLPDTDAVRDAWIEAINSLDDSVPG